MARIIQLYLDGETDEVTAQRVARHLADCSLCGLEAQTYRAIKHALARHARPPAEAVTRLREFADSLAESPEAPDTPDPPDT